MKLILKELKNNKILFMMISPVVIGFVLFHYFSMYGLIIAFKDYDLVDGYFGSNWVGFKHFISFFRDPYLFRIVRNTFLLGIYSLLWGFFPPIILAIMFNEMRNAYFRRVTQTIAYLPHFIAIVIIVGMLKDMLSPDGIVNQFIVGLGFEQIRFFNDPKYFRFLYIFSSIWQEVGFGSILYLASLMSINSELYEASYVDGANRLQRILFISIPGMVPIMVILLIIKMGRIVATSFEKVYLMYSPQLYETADVIATYVYRRGIIHRDFSYGAAVGLLNSLVSFALVYIANIISRRVSETSLW